MFKSLVDLRIIRVLSKGKKGRSTRWALGSGCDPKMGLRCISLRLLICKYVRNILVVRIAQNAVDFSVFKGVGSQILGDRRLA